VLSKAYAFSGCPRHADNTDADIADAARRELAWNQVYAEHVQVQEKTA
jgi:hypothetical protein